MRSILVSFFNSNNIGDIVIGDRLCKLVSKHSSIDLFSFTGNINVQPLKKKYTFSDLLKKFFYQILNKYNFNKIIKIYYKKIKSDDFEIFKDKIITVDTLIIGGGNMIFELGDDSSSIDRFDRFVKTAIKEDKNVFAICLGIGPFKTIHQEKNAVKSLSQCDYITFRDDNSFEIFKKHNPDFKNVYLGIDPVFLLPQEIFKVDKINEIVLGLNIINNKLINNSEIEYDLIVSQYANLAKELTLKLNVKVVLFCTEFEDFKSVLDVFDLLKNNKNISIRRTRDYAELMSLYQDLSLVIGTRMHAMILAYTQRIPIIGLSYQTKVDEMFKIIKKEKYLFKYDCISTSLDDILISSSYILDNIDDEIIDINTRISDIIERNMINEQILIALVNGLNEK